ncbi:exonuclease V, chloroplastic-like [Gastrolobium bilobum]|uniref:exonuclease V, chloroplastic-like n=1 Tax=Gastrolobium bilobum TaxID=150636 RepID=UPI002AB21725|nr:exonuclease V, chloroplastic-like [Gastrolobium bilobum]
MGETSSSLSSSSSSYPNLNIPIEIVTDEEMSLIEAAFALASTRSSSLSSFPFSSSTQSQLSSPHFQTNVLSIKSITVLSKRKLLGGNDSHTHHPDIEDSPKLVTPHKKTTVPDSFLHRFRRKRGLSVTDLTSTEWCPKQMEFSLLLGGRKTNQVMKAGIARHAKLEEEVIKRVEVKVKSQEDYWALKFLNFINGVNQLLFEGLTRELPIIGFTEDIWIVGVIDEIQMPLTENDHNPILIDTKTRARDTLPAEPQRRNGRLQLMCYKYLWDNLVADDFPWKKFFTYFGLNAQQNLSEDLKVISADSGFSASTLDDVVKYYNNTCRMLAPAHNQLLLRYEYQKDHSLLGEDKFAYDPEWLKNQMRCCIEFWLGEQEATCAPEEERWKCRFCQFATVCPAYTDSKGTVAHTSNDSNIKEG